MSAIQQMLIALAKKADISFDAYSWLSVNGVTITTNYVNTWNHTNNWSMLFVAFIPAAVWGTPINAKSATYNGVSMTNISGSNIFYLANPPIGTYTVSVTINFNSSLWSCNLAYHSASYKGTVATPVSYTATSSGTWQVSMTKALTATKDWHIWMAWVNNFRTLVAWADTNLRWHQTLSTSVWSDSWWVDSAGQGTYPWNQTMTIQNNDWNNSGSQLETFMQNN